MRRQGRISEWRDEQGFGFITPNGGGEKLFLHIKAFQPPARRPLGKEWVDFHLDKSVKRGFLALFWTVSLVNLVALGWLLSSQAGAELLKSMAGN